MRSASVSPPPALELTPLTVMPLAKASSQYDEFDMYWDGALVLANTVGAAILGGIKQ